ncbi:MAG TPA: urease accessory UreF family protein [Phycisphaerae bacterium]|nr:urease accessory UreF family protein [Phycisphaerae bacterium]
MNVLGLVQLCEVAQPVGGYSHSLGIERMAREGRLRSSDDLLSFVRSVLQAGIGPADGVASGIAFRAARNGALDSIPEVCAAMSSERLPMEMRLASVQMGQRLWAVSRTWGWAEPIHEQLDGLAVRTDLHHAVAFGALVSETTSSQVRAIATYLFNTAKSIVMAAVSAIPLDETSGQHVLSDVQPTIAQLAAMYADKGMGDIGRVRGV